VSNPSQPDDRPNPPGSSDQAPPPPPPPPPAPGWGQAPQAPPPPPAWQGAPGSAPGGPIAPYGVPRMSDAQARQWAMFAHLSALLAGLVLAGLTFIGPLVVWLIKREESAFVAEHAKEALNFNITVTIAYVVFGVLSFVIVGIPFLIVTFIAWLVLTIMAAVKASNGEMYRYPLTLRLVT
jgi:uncharacterized protein